MRQMLAAYDDGRIGEALSLARRLPRNRTALALAALTNNQPAQAMTATAQADRDPRLLRLRARAAWLLGDGPALNQAVDDLGALDEAGGDLAELRAMAAVAKAAEGGRLRRASSGSGSPMARFDPGLGVPIVELKIGDKSARFIWDTGAELTVIDAGAAAKFGVQRPAGATVTLSANTGETQTVLGLLPRVELLGLALEDVPVVLADLSALPAQLKVVGVIGVQDLLRDQRVMMDYSAGVIRRGETPGEGSGWSLRFVKARSIVAVEGRVDGGPAGLFRVDTGGRHSMLTRRYLTAALKAGAKWEVSTPDPVEARAVGQAERQRRQLKRGGFCPTEGAPCVTLTGVPVDTTPADSLTCYAGKLGADAFRGRVLTFDYPACELNVSEPVIR